MTRLARFETRNAARYLATLCKHFGRKLSVEMAGGTGRVHFAFGRCDMIAGDSHLDLRATAPDADGLARVVTVMTDHLERYAFRENPVLDWRTAPD